MTAPTTEATEAIDVTDQTPPHVPRVTNGELGVLMGLSHSSVSRLRSGERGTSTTVMLTVEKELGWDLHDQIQRRDDGTYAEELERRALVWKSRKLAEQR